MRISPARLRVELGASRRVRAEALDGAGRPLLRSGVSFSWELHGSVGSITEVPGASGRAVFTAGPSAGEAVLAVAASEGERQAAAAIPVEVVDELGSARSDEGIPEPDLLDQIGRQPDFLPRLITDLCKKRIAQEDLVTVHAILDKGLAQTAGGESGEGWRPDDSHERALRTTSSVSSP